MTVLSIRKPSRCAGLLRRLRRDEDGGSLLEMTVVTPFLLMLGLGVFEFGNAFYQYHLITAGVRDAGRFAAGLEESTDTETKAKELAIYGKISDGVTTLGDADKRVSWWDIEHIDVNYNKFDNDDGSGNKIYRGGDEITVVRIDTSVEYDDLGLLSYFGLGPITITTHHEEKYFGVR